MLRGLICVLALTAATAASAGEQTNPAHAIAQKIRGTDGTSRVHK